RCGDGRLCVSCGPRPSDWRARARAATSAGSCRPPCGGPRLPPVRVADFEDNARIIDQALVFYQIDVPRLRGAFDFPREILALQKGGAGAFSEDRLSQIEEFVEWRQR